MTVCDTHAKVEEKVYLFHQTLTLRSMEKQLVP